MEDEPVSILIEVHAGRLGLPPARIADPLLTAPAPLRTGARGGRLRIEARFGRRGRRVLVLPRVLIADPLGLATREVSARPSPGDDELLVLPRIEPVVAAPGGGDASRIARRGRPAVGAEVELDGIRPLRDGTPASRIFWPAVARGAEPQERFLTAASESRPVVVLDPRGAAERGGPRRRRPRGRLAGAGVRERGRLPGPAARRPAPGRSRGDAGRLAAPARAAGPHRPDGRADAGQRGPAARADHLRQRAYARACADRPRPGPRRDADRRRARAAALAPRAVRRRRLLRLRAQRAADPRRPRTQPGAAEPGMSIAPPPPAPPAPLPPCRRRPRGPRRRGRSRRRPRRRCCPPTSRG